MSSPKVCSGLDRLARGEGPSLRGAKVSLLCHPASQSAALEHAEQVLRGRCAAEIVSLLGPEHGLDASAQDMIGVDDAPDLERRLGPPTYSLYGDSYASLWPQSSYFHDAQWLVIDLQDVGARYYTYVWTAAMTAEVALQSGIKVLLLDRPNPLGGASWQVEGGAIEAGFESFVGYHDVSARHGMTLAEIVRLTLSERAKADLGGLCELTCQGWRRDMLFHQCGLPWVMPSPNMPTLLSAIVYPGQCLFEGTLMSEGRGSTRPFELVGAPWIDPQDWIARVDPELLPGLALRPLAFEPTFQKHARISCPGLQLHVQNPFEVRSLRSAWALLSAAYAQSVEGCNGPRRGEIAAEGRKGHEDARRRFEWRSEIYEFEDKHPAIDLLAGGPRLRHAIEAGEDPRTLLSEQEAQRQRFLERREPFLLYPEPDSAPSDQSCNPTHLHLCAADLGSHD